MNQNEIEEIALTTLKKTYDVHQELGAFGEKDVKKNQFWDTALKCDIEAEKAVLEVLKKAKVPIKIISEEHGDIEIGKNPIYLGILDGLDGSSVYKKSRGKGRYGTMFGIFSNLNPSYSDYIFSGAMEHSTNRLFYSTKGKGNFIITNNDKSKQIHCSNVSKLNEVKKIYIDEYFDINKKTFSSKLQDFNPLYLGSSCVYYIDLASGEADLVLECTRKGNLEIAVAYGLETESGAVMVDLDGKSLGDKKYFEFGQDKNIPVISASTKKLAQELINFISKD